MISSIILCAGSSARIGTPKALLKIGNKTFLEHIVDLLLGEGVKHINVVVGADADKIKSAHKELSANFVVNERWQEGQLSSLITGLNVLDEKVTTGVLVWPVDHSLVSKTVIRELVNTFENNREMIVIPKYHGQRGHPVIFPKSVFNELRFAPLSVGARAVVHNHPEKINEIETDDEGVIINIDTPEDYKRISKIQKEKPI